MIRRRLNLLVDKATHSGALWIAAEPGAGKSTLAAAWSSTRTGRLLWYRVDEGDADAGVAFGYLTDLARTTRRSAKLPIYRGRDVERLEVFSRTFLRAFFDVIPGGATIVIDDAHDAAGSDFDVLLTAAVREAPRDVALLILSRRDPDGALLEEVGRGTIRTLESGVLAFTADEATKLLASMADEATARRMHAQTNGWAAGMLMLAQGATGAVRSRASASEWISSYFDRMVLDRLDDAECRILAAANLLPEIDVDALHEIGIGETAPPLLDRLRALHSFVTRLDRVPPSWHLHDLLRDALRRRFESIGDTAWRRDIRGAAANVAAKQAFVREAVRLHLDADDVRAARAVAERFARELVKAQRLTELDAVEVALGEEIVDDSVPLQIALGEAAWQRNDARTAVARFERAMALIGDGRPSAAGLVTAASALTAILEGWQDFGGSVQWVKRLSLHLQSRDAIADPGERLRIDAVCLRARDMLGQASLGDQRDLVKRIFATLREHARTLRPEQALAACGVVIETAGLYLSDERLFSDVVDASTPWLHKPDTPPLSIANWLSTYAPIARRWPTYGAKLPAATPAACLELAVRLATECGAQSTAFSAAYALANQAIANNDCETAEKRLAMLREIADSGHTTQTVNLLQIEGAVLALSGEWKQARSVLIRALELSRRHDFPLAEQWSIGLYLQRVEIAAGDANRAREALLQESQRYPEGMRRDLTAILADVAAAAYALRTEGAIPADLVRRIVQRASELGWPGFATLLAPIAGRLCAEALRMGVEDDFVRRVIRERNLPAPDPYEPWWPWPIRIQALGTLRVEVDGAAVEFGPRVPRKPLELLKLLIARGPAPVDAAVVFDALWPDADGAEARGAFDMAAMRLRKLLARDDALRLDGGRIGLDPACVWVDAFAFERGGIEAYPGPLFGDDAVESWWASARERLHQRFLRRTHERGMALEESGDFEQALALYEAALAQDPLAEDLYRGSIRCHLIAGRAADALRVYRRCRDQLSIVLGVSPSKPTSDLVAKLSVR